MFIKIIAKGFVCQRMSYLRNGWNVLDFVVVISSYTSYLSELIVNNDFEVGNLEFLRIFRVLRAFKTISILPGLKKIVNALINSAVQLFEVLGLTLFVIMICALVGMEFFHGHFRNKCVRIQGETNDDGTVPQFREITKGLSFFMTDWLYNMWVENEHNWLYRDFPDSEALPCGNSSTARHCEDGYVCLEIRNSQSPNNGWISFDTFLLAALQTLQVMTLDYWERTYEIAMSTVGRESVIYFILVIFIGGYYMLNLMLAVVTLCYEKEQSSPDIKSTKLSVQKRLELTRQMSNFHFEHLNQQRLRLFEGYRNRSGRERDELLLRMMKAEEFAHPVMRDRFESSAQCVSAMYKVLQINHRYKALKLSQTQLQQNALTNKYRKPLPEDGCYEEYQMYEGHSDAELDDEHDDKCLKLGNGQYCNLNLEGFDQTFVVQNKTKFITRPVQEKTFPLYPDQPRWESIKIWLGLWRHVVQPLVEDWKWRNLMTCCIFINTVISCLEHHRQPKWLDQMIYYSNETFTDIFLVELVLKAIAYQHHFFQYGWNKFDLFVVIGSVVDTHLQNFVGYKGLRALKLLRILKLAQAWDTMKILLNILIGAMGEMANLILILFIAIYIFAIFGMQFLAGGYEPTKFRADFYPANYPRLAWQNLFSSFIMVFRVFCGEWIVLTWECIEAHRSDKEEFKCFLMFIPTLVLGNFIILNLFVALLLHIFDSADEMKKSLKENRRGRAAGFRRFWKRLKRRFSKEQVKKKVEKKKKVAFQWMKGRNKIAPLPLPSENAPEDLAISQTEEQGEEDSKSKTDLGSIKEALSTPTNTAPTTTNTDVPPTSAISPFPLFPEANKKKNILSMFKAAVAAHRQLRIVLPYRLPKWRFYKVVLKYKEYEDGKIDHDSDVDDEELMHGTKRETDQNEANDEFQENQDEASVGKNQRFREVAYRVVLMIRKTHGEKLMAAFERAKEQQLRDDCLAARANKNKDTVDDVVEVGEKVKEEVPLNPCFPLSWYSKARCFSGLLEKTNDHPTLDFHRRKILCIVNHSSYEWLTLVLIIISSVLLTFDDIHLNSRPRLKKFLFYSSSIITLIFLTDFCLKVFAKGVHFCFTNGWMLLDFIVVMVCDPHLIYDESYCVQCCIFKFGRSLIASFV
ncbi:unnamed protein product [Orchesella dallaii]|uniref:Ion transport domain-containing protein n=1 Tax=Orchesella dallaii TaxID=48710 RepID=A0ABP1S2D8_9HEXA